MKNLQVSDFAVSSMIAMPSDLFAFIEAVSSTSFRKIEIRAELKHWDYDEPGNIDKIKKLCQKSDLKILSLHAPMSAHISSPDEYDRVKSLREVEKTILIASRLGAPFVVIHSDTLNDFEKSKKKDALQISLEELSDFALRWNTVPLLENLMPPRLASDPAEITGFLDFMEDSAGLCLDLGHLRISGFDYNDLTNEFNSRVKTVHLNDNDGKEDRHWPPGFGDAPGHSKKDIISYFDRGYECVIEASKRTRADLDLRELLFFIEDRVNILIS
ncbi:sugar phosphate isomerase/epimerase [candidate division WOR-3 bacterium]|nr:sugar phosphate isomerase/epimerase [candidate division WOR-3 bacterium]